MYTPSNIDDAIMALKSGNVIAYPTEGVYGLGCDPFNEKAIIKLNQLKNRTSYKGYILIGSSWSQLEPLVVTLPQEKIDEALHAWQTQVLTWVMPAADTTPKWLCQENQTIGLRLSYHPTVIALCEGFGGPIVSTSANVHTKNPARDIETLSQYFKDVLIVEGALGELEKPTPIRDLITGEVYRA